MKQSLIKLLDVLIQRMEENPEVTPSETGLRSWLGRKGYSTRDIEAAMKNHELVAECVVIGDRRKFLSALVTLDEEALERVAKDRGWSGDLYDHDAVRAEIDTAVEATNAQFARVEHIRKYAILRRNFMVEEGELTPTLKIKRRVINEHFADEIEAMYAD